MSSSRVLESSSLSWLDPGGERLPDRGSLIGVAMGVEPSRWATRAVAHVASRSGGGRLDRSLRITLNFHPDRLTAGHSTLEHLVRDGVYRSQFETGTSNGGLTAYPGGDRWRWEQRIFGRAYDDAPPGQRPRTDTDEQNLLGMLDDYIEAHVHGVVRIDRDVEAVVLDPCYRGTTVEDHARKLAVPLEWHEGREIAVTELARHPEYRGPHIVDVARAIARDGVLDAQVIGRAFLAARHDPQDLKKVWHHVARFGTPPDRP